MGSINRPGNAVYTGRNVAMAVNLFTMWVSTYGDAGRQLPSAWLGVQGITVKPGLERSLGVSSAHGALVEFVTPGSPAAKANIRAGSRVRTVQGNQQVIGGDVIVGIDGTAIRTFSAVARAVQQATPGSVLVLRVVRGHTTLTVRVRLARNPWRT
jgi:S1-C subfamily serine protease